MVLYSVEWLNRMWEYFMLASIDWKTAQPLDERLTLVELSPFVQFPRHPLDSCPRHAVPLMNT